MTYLDRLTYLDRINSMRLLSVLFSLSAIFCNASTNSSESRIERTSLGMGVNVCFSLFDRIMPAVSEDVARNHFKDFAVKPNCGTGALRGYGNKITLVLSFGFIYDFFHTVKVIQRNTNIKLFNKFNIS